MNAMPPIVRVVMYARYSSNLQRDASIEDQLRVCSDRAERQGWVIVHVFSDSASSGATISRAGYQAMLARFREGGIDIVIAESLDRFSRDLEHIAAFHKQCSFLGVGIHTLAEGDITELHVGLKGTMGALYLKDLADKTRRGLEGRIHAGRCTGSPPYGYEVVRKMREDGEIERGLRAIDPANAAIVKRIFVEYAAGTSPRKIAHTLNGEKIPGPGGGIWYDSSIRGREKRRDGILRNALYIGEIVWRRRRNLKDPATGARLRRDMKPDSFVTAQALELRIIDDALWAQVQTRLQAEAAKPVAEVKAGPLAFWAQRRPKHLLSGKVICGICGRPFYPIGKDYLACQAAKQGACGNHRTPRRGRIESHVIDILGRQLMQPELLAEFVHAFEAEWTRLHSDLKAQAASQQRERQAIERKIANLVDIISDGGASQAILAKLRALEATRETLGKTEMAPSQGAQRLRSGAEMAYLYKERIAGLAASMAKGDNPKELEIARGLIDQVVIHPSEKGGPVGIEFIGSLIELLKMAGLGGSTADQRQAATDPVLALFVSSVKEGPGAEPLA